MHTKSRNGWLYLRRYPGEKIVIFDAACVARLKIVDIDPDERIVQIVLTGHAPAKLRVYEQLTILQGDGKIRLGAIEENADGTCFASIGIKAPRSILVRREELVRGMSNEELHNLAA